MHSLQDYFQPIDTVQVVEVELEMSAITEMKCGYYLQFCAGKNAGLLISKINYFCELETSVSNLQAAGSSIDPVLADPFVADLERDLKDKT